MENPLSISSLLGLFNLYIVDQVATFFDIPFRKSTFIEPFFFKTIINSGLTDSKYIAACIIIHSLSLSQLRVYSYKWKHTYFRKLVFPSLPHESYPKLNVHSAFVDGTTSVSPQLNRKKPHPHHQRCSSGEKVELSASALGIASR